ncbi:MAG: bifunctional precorrin-2 dehydrogenase/sirohydrochlorin ferrochelatase [Dehalococcoidia bacterium]|nr:bifunctional precorrin-2 dehydrogenase/sirohydrochlorin ferrochelatase [Dehalococcoidia bacterium]
MSVMIELLPSAGPVLVVGGGAVALRRVRNLSDGGFRITVVAPSILDEIRGLPGVTCFARTFIDTDIPDGESRWALVLACTGERDVNRRIGEAARAHAIPVVVADSQDESTFFTPATLRDGGLQVAVSTGGADPALAKQLREKIATALGPGWASLVERARSARQSRLGRTKESADE